MALWTFLRHGQSTANAEGWLSGHRDVPLTSVGIEQAEAARGALANYEFGQAWTSDLQRASHTARIVLADRRAPALQVSQALRERSLGVWEGRIKEELRREGLMERLVTWTGAPDQGESLAELASRAVPFLDSIDNGTDTLIVAHGGLIRVLVGLIDGTKRSEIGRFAPRNCEAIHRTLPQGSWNLLNH